MVVDVIGSFAAVGGRTCLTGNMIFEKKPPASNINPSTSYIIHPFTPTHSLHCLDNVYKHLYEEIYKRKRRKEEKGSEASLEHDKSIRKGLDREER